ncbi:MAG: hypothetical protein GY758_26150, partial [Fuerstiella sp.]|nr:hypothetical protein [Fuerstiella sp.]
MNRILCGSGLAIVMACLPVEGLRAQDSSSATARQIDRLILNELAATETVPSDVSTD